MCADNHTFMDWLANQEVEPNDDNICEETYKVIFDAICDDDKIQEAYYDFRKDAVIEELQMQAADYGDEDMRDYYLDL